TSDWALAVSAARPISASERVKCMEGSSVFRVAGARRRSARVPKVPWLAIRTRGLRPGSVVTALRSAERAAARLGIREFRSPRRGSSRLALAGRGCGGGLGFDPGRELDSAGVIRSQQLRQFPAGAERKLGGALRLRRRQQARQ